MSPAQKLLLKHEFSGLNYDGDRENCPECSWNNRTETETGHTFDCDLDRELTSVGLLTREDRWMAREKMGLIHLGGVWT